MADTQYITASGRTPPIPLKLRFPQSGQRPPGRLGSGIARIDFDCLPVCRVRLAYPVLGFKRLPQVHPRLLVVRQDSRRLAEIFRRPFLIPTQFQEAGCEVAERIRIVGFPRHGVFEDDRRIVQLALPGEAPRPGLPSLL